MRHYIIVILSVLWFQTSVSQIYEVGVFIGGSNLISDVGATNYIKPNQMALGGILKWNRSPRHSWRISAIYTTFEALDSQSDDPRRLERGYNYENNSVLEISAGMEFTFFDFNLHSNDIKATPYLYSGITATHHDNYYFRNGIQTSEDTSSWAYGIPIVLGFKTNVTDHIILAAEIGARYVFSDELDGSVPDTPELSSFTFGNVNNNDWYTFTGVTLTYTFGRRPCYCNF
jgi:opacity protein-like surface antigen